MFCFQKFQAIKSLVKVKEISPYEHSMLKKSIFYASSYVHKHFGKIFHTYEKQKLFVAT